LDYTAEDILAALDQCCSAYTFPMLDNGYVYLAATRMALFRSAQDWAMSIEVFGFSPLSEVPDTHIQTFGSRLRRQRDAGSFVTPEAFAHYLAVNPHNESVFVHPVEGQDWLDPEQPEFVAPDARSVQVRGVARPVPGWQDYARQGISLENPPQVQVFELCRHLAATSRDAVLATPTERRRCVPPELEEILLLDEWCHPDVATGALPGQSAAFRQLTRVLVTGDATVYQPEEASNTHWSNWPDGGRL
jgi:hypothetical protein